jgi:hypothetical protein
MKGAGLCAESSTLKPRVEVMARYSMSNDIPGKEMEFTLPAEAHKPL